MLDLATLLAISKGLATAVGVGTGGIKGAKLAADLVSWLEDRPLAEDKKEIRAYVQRLNDRRVFYVPLHSERANACVGSLGEVKRWTEEARSKIKHGGLQAALAGIQGNVRAFLDTWQDRPFVQTGNGSDPENLAFLVALGELRGAIRHDLEFIKLLDDKVKLTNIIPPPETR